MKKETQNPWTLRIYTKKKRRADYIIDFADSQSAFKMLENIYGQLSSNRTWLLIEQVVLPAESIAKIEIEEI